jgi:pimeloyl-[acyl-carrier protein] methyl ester esterase
MSKLVVDRLVVDTLGDEGNPPLVLLHGWAMNAEILQPLAVQLSKSFHVHSVNLPGFGGSAEVDFRPERLAPVLLDHLPQKALWMGWSMGGQIAAYVAHTYPARVMALVTLGSTPHFMATPDWTLGVPKELYEGFLHTAKQDPVQAIKRFSALTAVGEDQLLLLLIKAVKDTALKTAASAQVLTSALEWMGAWDGRSLYPQIHCPSLHLFGSKDAIVRPDIALQVKQLNPSHFVQVVSGSHLFPISRIEEVADAFDVFAVQVMHSLGTTR